MKMLSTAFEKQGFARFASESESETTLHIAEKIGNVLSIPGVSPIQRLVPRQSDSLEKSNYSGIYGTHQFPLHTDMAHWCVPPRFFLLRCIQPGDGVHTNFLHTRDLFGGEDQVSLRRALFRPRRRLDGRLTLLRLFDGDCYRWDSIFIQPINAVASNLRAQTLARIQAATVQAVEFQSSRDCILVDNWKVLHGRSAVPTLGAHRIVERVYLDSVKL
jgi:L-asparagine oxygenase